MASSPAARPCERVLVVNDNPDMLATMKDVLELGGARVITATSRQQADGILVGGFDPSVIVLDVRLGGGDRGDDYARTLRATHPDLPVVLMSGDVHELRRLDPDVDATISKPFDIDRLFEILSELCAPKSAHGS